MSKRKSYNSDSNSMEVETSKRAKNEMVSFSKRRRGLFGKASELCTKFNSQIAILVLSPSENPFAFGHSSVDEVLRRYYNLRPRTTAVVGGGEEGNAVSERQRRQERELVALKAMVREKERTGRESLDLASLVNDNVERCESVEELEVFKVKYLALLNKVREKLRDDMSFVASGSGSSNVADYNGECNNEYQQNDMSFSYFGLQQDMKNDMSPTDGSGGGSKNTAVESDDFFDFADQICDGIGLGDVNNGFFRRIDDMSFVASASGSGSSNVADYNGECNNEYQQNDMSFSYFGLQRDKKNDMSPTDGSGGGSKNTAVESDDFFDFADQICDGIGLGDVNKSFCRRFDENFEQFQDLLSLGNDRDDYESYLWTGEKNDAPIWVTKSYDDNNCGARSSGGFGSVMTTMDGSCQTALSLRCETTLY